MEEFSGLIIIALCVAVGYWAKKRGRRPVVWGLLALVITPLFAAIILALKDNLAEEEAMENTPIPTQVGPSDVRVLPQEPVAQEPAAVPAPEEVQGDEEVVIGLDDLQKLKQMLDEGIITQEEFDAAKKKALS